MTHIRVTDAQSVFPPSVYLGGGRGPEDIVEKHITKARLLTIATDIHQVTDAYEAALHVGDSTGGPRKACGNSLVLKIKF